MNLLRSYVDRSRFELRTTLRDGRTVMFSMLLPIFLLVIFGSVFHHAKIGRSGVSFSQYFVAGMLASAMLYSAFQLLAISVPEERSNGTLKRIVGSPMPRSTYFVGKFVVCVFIYTFQVIFLLGIGHLFYDIRIPSSASSWLTFVWVSLLGLMSAALLGIAFSSFAKDGRAASALAAPLVLYFQFTSGVYFVYTTLPPWMQDVAAVFPLKWMAQSMRGVFLPAGFAVNESGHSYQFVHAAVILSVWTLLGIALCRFTFRWLPKGSD